MTIRDLANRNYNKARGIARVVYNRDFHGWNRTMFYGFLRKNNVEVERVEPKVLDDMVSMMNRQVKDAACPNNCKNNFYTWKHRYIKKHIRLDNIEKVLESEKCYHFFLRDGHDYHQLKNTFPDGVEHLAGTEEYVAQDNVVAFNEDDFRKTIAQMILFVDF